MITRTNIMIDQAVKETGQRLAKELGLRGKFSEYIELLIKADLNKKKKRVLTDLEFDKIDKEVV